MAIKPTPMPAPQRPQGRIVPHDPGHSVKPVDPEPEPEPDPATELLALIADITAAHMHDLATQANGLLHDFLIENGPITLPSSLGYQYTYMAVTMYPGWRRVPMPNGVELT